MSEWEPISETSSETVVFQKRTAMFLLFVLGLILSALMVWVAMKPESVMDSTSSATRRGRQGAALKNLMGDSFIYLFWLGAAIFIAMTLYYLVSIFKPARLILADKGLTVAKFHSEKTYSWENVTPFMLMEVKSSGVKKQYVEFLENVEGTVKRRKLLGGLDIENSALVQALNEYRARALNPDIAVENDAENADAIPHVKAVASSQPEPTLKSTEGWQAPHEREGFAVKEERAPWGRWIAGFVVLGLVLAGALWLASKVVVPRDIPVAEKTKDKAEEKPAAKIGADDAAWTKALEKDTLAGYREYLEEFPDGKHADKAKAEIAAYDDKAWARAQGRDTIAGYEDYIKEWPEGQHVEKAQDRIKQIKDAAEAARKAQAAKVAAEKAAWERAAQANTVQSYQNYLARHAEGPNAPEAQNRIDRLQASAADNAAWQAASAANTASSYQQYLTSFPQGAYAAQAIAAIENLRPSVGKTFRDCNECPEMVSLPAGTASLGAGDNEADARPNEKPQRPVTFADMFAIGVTEVTFAEYGECVRAGACSGAPSDNGWGGGNRPIINVSWDDAQKYAAWLSAKTGKSYALPTEAQWEYAARAGDSKPLAGGSLAALCAFANGAGQESGLKWANNACTDPAIDRTLPTGMLSANKFGVKDMIGNVAEWTQDCNTLNLRDAPTDGSADARGSCNQRVVRGGSWFSGPADLRYASRLMQRRGDSNDFTGFRLIRKTGP